MKLFLLSAIFMNVFVLPWGLGDATSLIGGLLGTLAVLGKLAVRGLVIVIIDSSFGEAAVLPDRRVPGRRVPGRTRVDAATPPNSSSDE